MTTRRNRKWLPAVVLAPLGIALFAASPAPADHTGVNGIVRVFRGDSQVAVYSSGPTGCGTSCGVPVTLSNRDYGRFVKWCGTDIVHLTVPAGSSFANSTCPGGGSWRISVEAILAGPSGTTTHSEDVQPDILARK